MMPRRYPILLSVFVLVASILAGCGGPEAPTSTPLPPPTVTTGEAVPSATAANLPATATVAAAPPTATLAPPLPGATETAVPPSATPAPALPTLTVAASPPTAIPAPATLAATAAPARTRGAGASPTPGRGAPDAVISRANLVALAPVWTQKETAPAGAPAFSPDGSYLGVADGAHSFHLLQARDGKQVRAVDGDTGAFAPDGVSLATADKQAIYLWRLDSRAPVGQVALAPFADLFVPVLAYGPAGTLLAAGADPSVPQVFVWNALLGGKEPVTLEPDDVAQALAFAPDRRTVAIGTGVPQVELWPAGDGPRLGMSEQHGRGVNVLAWSPDGTLIADASHEMAFSLRRASDLREVGRLGSTMRISVLAFSPDGSLLAVGTNTLMISTDPTQNVVEIWDVAGQQLLHTLTGINEGITGLAWAPDGTALAATTLEGTCRVWRVR